MKSKKKVIGILFIIVLIAAIAGFAYLYFFTDMFKTPEEMFYKYLEKISKNESDYSYQTMLEDLKNNQPRPGRSNRSSPRCHPARPAGTEPLDPAIPAGILPPHTRP